MNLRKDHYRFARALSQGRARDSCPPALAEGEGFGSPLPRARGARPFPSAHRSPPVASVPLTRGAGGGTSARRGGPRTLPTGLDRVPNRTGLPFPPVGDVTPRPASRLAPRADGAAALDVGAPWRGVGDEHLRLVWCTGPGPPLGTLT